MFIDLIQDGSFHEVPKLDKEECKINFSLYSIPQSLNTNINHPGRAAKHLPYFKRQKTTLLENMKKERVPNSQTVTKIEC